MDERTALTRIDDILRTDFATDPAACAGTETTRWMRADRLQIELLVENGDFRAVGTLCEIDFDADLGEVLAAIKKANEGLEHARIFEADNYIRIEARTMLAGAESSAQLKACIDHVIAAAKARSALARFRSMPF
jgi:hypothetical protein